MSNRCSIGEKIKSNSQSHSIMAIYVHFDGYPSGVGQYLRRYWDNEKRVGKLIAQGNRNSLGADPDSGQYTKKIIAFKDAAESIFYGEPASIYQNQEDWFQCRRDVDYFYLWSDEGWMIRKNIDGCSWELLADILPAEMFIDVRTDMLAGDRNYDRVYNFAALATVSIFDWMDGEISYRNTRNAVVKFIESADTTFS